MSLRKGVYPNEYTDEWEKFNETSLSEKEEYYSNLNIDGTVLQVHITCMQKVCKEFAKCL